MPKDKLNHYREDDYFKLANDKSYNDFWGGFHKND